MFPYNSAMSKAAQLRYKVGIDVGLNSVGLAAVEVAADGTPLKLLNAVVYTHDSGVDPEQAKSATSRLAVAGVARRARHRVRRRKKRLAQLDALLESAGYMLVDNRSNNDPYWPWKVRQRLATEQVDKAELLLLLPVALRHIARHRGWRNPYSSTKTLQQPAPYSQFYEAMRERVSKVTFHEFDDSATPAQIVCEALVPKLAHTIGVIPNPDKTAAKQKAFINQYRVRGGDLHGKLHQQDLANEIHQIATMQQLPAAFLSELISCVFASESPKGKAAERAGKDHLPGQEKLTRAPKAHPAFQKFKIVSTLANLRVAEQPLSAAELQKATDFLLAQTGKDGTTWELLADYLGVSVASLGGLASAGADVEHTGKTPPRDITSVRILNSNHKALKTWWANADELQRAAMVSQLANSEQLPQEAIGAEAVTEFLEACDDDELQKLESISLPAGRAAYSVDSLEKLTAQMLATGCDLFTARQTLFNIERDWQPPVDPIGEPVGNPAVDRVLKIVNRWLLAAEHRWGTPATINIEHVRTAFASEAKTREYLRELTARATRNEKILTEMEARIGVQPRGTASSVTRWLALARQRNCCLYCGTFIDFFTAEIDHIVPRKGPESTNTRVNLAAACKECNKDKSNRPFAVWAEDTGRPNVSYAAVAERVRNLTPYDNFDGRELKRFKQEVLLRLKKRTPDEAIDSRSIASVAWMARELAARIKYHFRSKQEITVGTYAGSITADARRATGFEGKVELIGGKAKTRLDRRHHAMDAAIVALLRPSVAQTLAIRSNMRQAENLSQRHTGNWKQFDGADHAAQKIYAVWRQHMEVLLGLFNEALQADNVPVTQNLRLGLGNSKAHDDTVRPFYPKGSTPKHLGDAWSVEEIDRASTPQLWLALTRLPDFDAKTGLPENLQREIRVKNQWFSAPDVINIFPKSIAAIAVREGWAEIGSTIHHARLYRLAPKKPGGKPEYGMVRVFMQDLLRHSSEDLFTVPLPPESISLRTAQAKVREQVLAGTAKYLTWIVSGTELAFDSSAFESGSGALKDFLTILPETNTWTITGFYDTARITIKPRQLSAEGLENQNNALLANNQAVCRILGVKGLQISLNVLLQQTVEVIHRNALGEKRYGDAASNSLPTTVQLKA